jgi:oxygen-dependent protoporphyrinogen oxidase
VTIAVIGGGITGLSAAWELARKTQEVVLIEPGPFGGLLRSEAIEDCLIECGADSWLASKPWLRNLAGEMGLADDVIPCNEAIRQTFILRCGVLYPLPRGLRLVAPTEWKPLVESDLLSPATKLRMLLELRRKPSDEGDRSVSDFVRDHFGGEAVEYLAEPLFAGVYGGSPEKLGMAGVLPGMLEHERIYGSVIRGALREPKPSGPLFESMRGGLGQIPSAIVERLASRIRIIRDAAEKVETGRVRVSGDWLKVDQVLIASGAPSAARLLAGSPAADLLRKIHHSSATIFVLGFHAGDLKRKPAGFGFLVPRAERRTIMAATWVTNKFPHRAPADKAIVRCFVAGDHNETLLDEVRHDFSRITGIDAAPWFARVYRWPDSMPQYGVGHAELVGRIEGAMPSGVRVAGAFLRGVGMPDCVKCATRVAGQIPVAGTSPERSHANPRSAPLL